MEDKVAIITGASTGIGRCMSIELSNSNFHVILISRNKKKLEFVKKEIDNLGNKCTLIEGDVSSEDSIKSIFNQIKLFNNIEILINNAGLGIFSKIQNISYSDWDKQMNTNLKGSFMMTKNIVPIMINNNCGQIIFINSGCAFTNVPAASESGNREV